MNKLTKEQMEELKAMSVVERRGRRKYCGVKQRAILGLLEQSFPEWLYAFQLAAGVKMLGEPITSNNLTALIKSLHPLAERKKCEKTGLWLYRRKFQDGEEPRV